MGTVVGPTPYYRGKMFRVRYDDDSMEDLTSNDLDAIMLRHSKRDSHGPDKDLEVSEAVDMTRGDIDSSADPQETKGSKRSRDITEWWQEYFEANPDMEFEFQGEMWKVYAAVDAGGVPYVAYYDAERKDRPRSMDDAEVGDFELTNKLAREKFGYTLAGKEFSDLSYIS
jgi:hypothetical protein